MLRGRIPSHPGTNDDAGMLPDRYPLVSLATHWTLKAGARNAGSSHQRRQELRPNSGDAGAVRLSLSVCVQCFFAVRPPLLQKYDYVINFHACYNVAVRLVADQDHFYRLINFRIFQP